MHCHGSQWINPTDFGNHRLYPRHHQQVAIFGFKSRALTNIGLIYMQFGTELHVPPHLYFSATIKLTFMFLVTSLDKY